MRIPRLRHSLTCISVLASTVCTADASCSTQEIRETVKVVRNDLRCRERKMLRGGPPCAPMTPPACGLSFHEALIETVFGDAPSQPTRLGSADARCQRVLVKSVRSYLKKRTKTLARGGRLAPRQKFVRQIERRCRWEAVRQTCRRRTLEVVSAGEPLATRHTGLANKLSWLSG